MMELYLYIAYEVRFKTLQKVLDKRLRLRILSKWQDSFLKRISLWKNEADLRYNIRK